MLTYSSGCLYIQSSAVYYVFLTAEGTVDRVSQGTGVDMNLNMRLKRLTHSSELNFIIYNLSKCPWLKDLILFLETEPHAVASVQSSEIYCRQYAPV